MSKLTPEEKFWQSSFGQEYLARNPFSVKEMDLLYKNNFGVTRSHLNRVFLKGLKIDKVLEVGCNVGTQLQLLQKQGFKNLYGVEIFDKAVERAKLISKGINIIQGSALDLPFKDNYFDLVFTSGVLIHVNPKDLDKVMGEIFRVSKKYIWGYEYFSEKPTEIVYRGNKSRMWKMDFAGKYLKLFPNLKLIKEKRCKYLVSDNNDSIFLLKK